MSPRTEVTTIILAVVALIAFTVWGATLPQREKARLEAAHPWLYTTLDEAEVECRSNGGRYTRGTQGATCDFSWDQEHLKAGDNTCATMVYHVDPDTKLLVQCGP